MIIKILKNFHNLKEKPSKSSKKAKTFEMYRIDSC